MKRVSASLDGFIFENKTNENCPYGDEVTFVVKMFILLLEQNK